MPVALDRVIRFAEGTRLVFSPGLHESTLAALAQAKPEYTAWLDALQTADCTVESNAVDRCTLRLGGGAATGGLRLEREAGETYHFTVEFQSAENGPTVSHSYGGLVLMLGGASEVYFTRRVNGEPRFLVKLSYAGAGDAAGLTVFTDSFAERLPRGIRAFIPAQFDLGVLRVASSP